MGAAPPRPCAPRRPPRCPPPRGHRVARRRAMSSRGWATVLRRLRPRPTRWPPRWPPSTRLLADGSSRVALRVRMALHRGTAERREGDYFGATVNRVPACGGGARRPGAPLGRRRPSSAGTLAGGVSLRDLGPTASRTCKRPEHALSKFSTPPFRPSSRRCARWKRSPTTCPPVDELHRAGAGDGRGEAVARHPGC